MGRFTDFLKAQGVSRANPYVDTVARHVGTMQDTGDLLGAFARGDIGKLPAAAKGVIIDGLLGTAIGVPGELMSQYGKDVAAAGFETVTDAATGDTRADGRDYRAKYDGTRIGTTMDLTGDVGINALALGLGGGGTAAPKGVRALNAILNGPAEVALKPLAKLGGAKKAKRAIDIPEVKLEVPTAPATSLATPATPTAQVSPPTPPVAPAPSGSATGASLPDYSLGNLNDRLNAAELGAEQVPELGTPGSVAALQAAVKAAYADKRGIAFPSLVKKLGARVEADGRVTRQGEDITGGVLSYLTDRQGLKGKKAIDARFDQLLQEVGTPKGAGGDLAAGVGVVSPTGRMLMANPEVLTTAIGATGGALAGGIADEDGGADGLLAGAVLGGATGLGVGRLPGGAIKDTLGVMHGAGKQAFREALEGGSFSFPSLAADWKADKVETWRGLALDTLSGRVRALINQIPQATINGTARSLIDRAKAAKAFVPLDQETEDILRLVGIDPASRDWAKTVGQGYMAGAGEQTKKLHPLASAAAGAAYSLAGPGALVPVVAPIVGAARGAARPYTSGAYRIANDIEQYATRNAAYKQEARGLLERAHAAFAGTLKAQGVDPSALRADGLYSPAEVEAIAPGAGAAWQGVLDQIFGVTPVKATTGKQAAPAIEGTRGLAGDFVVDAFGDYANPGVATKWLDRIAPFSRYAVGQAKPMARLAGENPAAAMALARWLAQDKNKADKEGRPGYQVGTVRIDTETPVVGKLVRAQLGGGDGEGRISPTAAISPVGGSNIGAVDKFADADTYYKWAEAVIGAMGFQFNPLIASAAYVVGGDYGTDRAPGAQSRTSGIEAALPGPRVAGLKGVLDKGREALGNEADDYDPVDLLAKEIIFERSKKPANDPINLHYRDQLLDPNSPLMQEAKARYEQGGAVRNAVSLVSPITAQVNTDEKVQYRQAQVQQEGAEKKSGAAAMYSDPRYASGSVRNGKKVDPRLREFEAKNSTLKRLAPQSYAKRRAAFIRENNIKD